MDNAHVGPEYIRGEDLQRGGCWAEVELTIQEVIPPNTVKAADKKLIDKGILCFEETEKRLIIGNTNKRLITCQLGPKAANWVGCKIKLHPVVGDWFGVTNALAVRVRIPATGPRPHIKQKNLGTDITGNPVQEAST